MEPKVAETHAHGGDYLKKIRAAYYEAGRQQPSEYDPLPSWESLPIQLREAFIHVWHDGHKNGIARGTRQASLNVVDFSDSRPVARLGRLYIHSSWTFAGCAQYQFGIEM